MQKSMKVSELTNKFLVSVKDAVPYMTSLVRRSSEREDIVHQPSIQLKKYNSDKPIQHLDQTNERQVSKNYFAPSEKSISSKFCTIIVFALIIIFGALCYDVRNQIEVVIGKIERMKQTCYQEMLQNQCHAPVKAVVERCIELNDCWVQDPQKSVKMSEILVMRLGKTINLFAMHLEIAGILFICGLICICLLFERKGKSNQCNHSKDN